MKMRIKASAGNIFPLLLCLLMCLPSLSCQAAEISGRNPDSKSSSPDRVVYEEGFFYEPLNEEVKARITGISYGEGCVVPYEQLRYLSVQYVDFNGESQTGEIICHESIAGDLIEFFYELYQAAYPIEKIRLVDEYGGDDNLSMEDNNTSCFNFRTVEGTEHLSKHAYGLAIDINPLYNPYVTGAGKKERVLPASAAAFADRSREFPYKITKEDLCYQLFTAHGFTWGGSWKSVKDYQHFQKELPEE